MFVLNTVGIDLDKIRVLSAKVQKIGFNVLGRLDYVRRWSRLFPLVAGYGPNVLHQLKEGYYVGNDWGGNVWGVNSENTGLLTKPGTGSKTAKATKTT